MVTKYKVEEITNIVHLLHLLQIVVAFELQLKEGRLERQALKASGSLLNSAWCVPLRCLQKMMNAIACFDACAKFCLKTLLFLPDQSCSKQYSLTSFQRSLVPAKQIAHSFFKHFAEQPPHFLWVF